MRTTWRAVMLSATMLAGAVQAAPTVPDPFVATYGVTYRGLSAGSLIFSFTRDANGHYVYETRVAPSVLARLVVSGTAVERSVMEITPDGVRPLEWTLDDGKSGEKDDGHLSFDWQRNRVTGRIKQQDVDLPLEPGVQDRLSIQIAVVVSLLRGQEPGTVALIDDNKVKRYLYTRKETATLDTAVGKLDTVVYESTREGGSSRVSRFWLTPAKQYQAARAEQLRKGKVETVMTLTKVEKPAS